MPANINTVLQDLDAGVFAEKINHALGQVARAVIDNEKPGKIVITLDLRKIANSGQVNIKHTLKYTRPTAKGSLSEDSASTCPMHVGKDGALTIFPENQTDVFDRD